MVNHLILLRWKDSAKDSEIDDVVAALVGLRDEVPGVAGVEVGSTIGNERFSEAILFTFADQPALQRYLEHPAHVAVARDRLKPLIEAVEGIDFRC